MTKVIINNGDIGLVARTAINDNFTELYASTAAATATASAASSPTANGSTTARTLTARFGEVANVKDFGATGDGVTNDSAAIQAAIDSLPSSGANQGGKVVFPRGSYFLSTGLVTTVQNIEFEGQGGRGQSRATAGGGPPLQMGRVTIIVADGITGLTLGTSGSFVPRGPVIRNIHFAAASATAAQDTRALTTYGIVNWLIDNCTFSGFNWKIGPATITAITWSAGTATVTTSAAHGFSIGHLVQILGVINSPAGINGYNGCWKVRTVPTTTTFTFANKLTGAVNPDPGTYSSAGTVYALSMAVKLAKESGLSTSGSTGYGTIRDCTFASANSIGGLWIDHLTGVKVVDCIFDGKDNGGTPGAVPAYGAALAITGQGCDSCRVVASDFGGYQTCVDVSSANHDIISCRYEQFGTGVVVNGPRCFVSGGMMGNGNWGSSGYGVAFGPGATDLKFIPSAFDGLGTSGAGVPSGPYLCLSPTAGKTFRYSLGDVTVSLDADITISATTTQTIATGLLHTIGKSPTEVWQFEGSILFTAANTDMDVLLGWNNALPSGATMLWGLKGTGTVAVSSSPVLWVPHTTELSVGAASGTFLVEFCGFVYGGATKGSVQLYFAQDTSDAGNLTMKAASSIRYRLVTP